MDKNERQRIALLTSTPMTVKVFLANQIEELSKLYDVTVISCFEGENYGLSLPPNVVLKSVPIKREINLVYDVYALFLLIIVLVKGRYSLVHTVTPKAGLLGMLASRAVGVKQRIHTFTGQVWATKKGLSRKVLMLMDKFIALMASRVLVDSFSQRDFLLSNNVLLDAKSSVLGEGSISGVNLEKFRFSSSTRESLRDELELPLSSIVLLFLGRLKRDKGVRELARSFSAASRENSDLRLVFVGPDEDNIRHELLEDLGESVENVRFIGFTNKPEAYMSAADIFCLPSYREGFGTVVIEAASCGLPSIGSSIYGLVDAIVHEETGLLVPVMDEASLYAAILRLAQDPDYRNRLGQNARSRAESVFSQEKITSELLGFYDVLLKS